MIKCINGWTKAKVLKVLRARRYNCAAFDKEEDSCVYLTKNGNKCAVGMFIPSGHKAQKSLLKAIKLFENYPELKDKMPLTPEDMCTFQHVHDVLDVRSNAKQAMIDWVKKNVKE